MVTVVELRELVRSLKEYDARGEFECAGLSQERAVELWKVARARCASEPNVVHVHDKPRVLVVGDLHGQLHELLQVFEDQLDAVLEECEAADDPDHALPLNIVFLGDYVDRGPASIEVLALVSCLKATFPTSVTLLRGNHETRGMIAKTYKEGLSFGQEIVLKFGEAAAGQVVEAAGELFDAFSLCAIVAPNTRPRLRFMCCHGGISHKIKGLDTLAELDRFSEPPLTGAFCDVLWSDPIDDTEAKTYKDAQWEEFLEIDFLPNPVRGCSYFYGYDLVKRFLEKHELVGIIRGHQVPPKGYREYYKDLRTRELDFAPCVTLFSASNYCGTYGNIGAVMWISEHGTAVEAIGGAEKVEAVVDESEFRMAEKKDATNERHPGWNTLRRLIDIKQRLGTLHKITFQEIQRQSSLPQKGAPRTVALLKADALASSGDDILSPSMSKVHSALSESFQEGDDKEIQALFRSLDKDNNGSLSLEELVQFIQSVQQYDEEVGCADREQQHQITRDDAAVMMSRMDTNKDGQVDIDEFIAYIGEFVVLRPEQPTSVS
ncbi:Calcineurin subunit A [Porphyridium purpureum]|uniref:Serine/threonine-protein phosphatase n=1 Tax=Porphyridium purpureum TaxID=35688 RepID=A0A5J4YK34_PORPP|nr:Calcineurin subunit A [Porphyridium purpureum]|eukprot:POR7006..scf244_11